MMKDRKKIVSIIGGSGFLGKYIAREFANSDFIVKIIARKAQKACDLKVSGYLGQFYFIDCDVSNVNALESAVKDSDIIVNCVAILHESKNATFKKMHVDNVKNLINICKAHSNIKKFIHISALGVDSSCKTSIYAKTKLEAEKAIETSGLNYAIIRPSVIFGPEDNFINMFSSMANFSLALPLVGGGRCKMQPVFVQDVALAALKVATSSQHKLIEAAGPKIYSFKEIISLILKIKNKKRILLSLPYSVSSLLAFFIEKTPFPLLTRDQVELLKYDNVGSSKNHGLKDLEITPHSMEEILPRYIS